MRREDFQLLTPENYQFVVQFNQVYPGESCEWSLSNLLLYRDTYLWHWAVIDERLWVVSFDQRYMLYPKGPSPDMSALRTMLSDLSHCSGGKIVCGDVPPGLAAENLSAVGLESACDPGESDYIYDLAHLASFSGSRLRKRHNQVRQFDREYSDSWCVAAITAEDLDEIIAFARSLSSPMWQTDTGREEKLAFGRLPELWGNADAGLAGIQLRVDGKLAGISIYSPLMKNMADIHFEKADHAYRGCGSKLTSLLVEHLLHNSYNFMNREQDLNEPGLRHAKAALDPARKYERMTIRLA